METAWSASLHVAHVQGGCRLWLGRYAYGDGDTLQDAADALMARLLAMAISWRAGGFRFPMEVGPLDVPWFEFLHELGDIAAAGGDIRERVFGCPPDADPAG